MALTLWGCHLALPLAGPDERGDSAGPLDQRGEQRSLEVGTDPDGPSTDGDGDAWPPPDQIVGPAACVVTGSVVQQYPGSGGKQMVVCEYPQSFNHCIAWARCAPPDWHVCTGSEYLARGGQATAPVGVLSPAWVAACVREDGVAAYKDRACFSCLTTTLAGQALVGQFCPSLDPFVQTSDWAGMATTTTKTTPATGDPGSCAFWSPTPAFLAINHVVCCD